ncbi:fasciclin domain-containing protein [Flagellimonas beolgyonensis]|uniref:fasciclin domain-containing protein n=1 Tax=Flagellimonas beolgyonensis TaxID=864064 RepID=UPI000F8DFF3C|nr:fasciclin domain-containing protein [Allomuricauda beolgyonensis]
MKTPIILTLLCAFLAFNSLTAQISNQESHKDFVQNGTNLDNHKILNAAVKATELDALLDNAGPFTIFAPSDAAFERFSSEKISELLNSKDKSALKSLLTYHIVAGQLTASRILSAMCRGNGKASFTTVQGKKLLAHLDGYDIVLTDPMGNTARITTADLNSKIGVVHEIDSVILPTQM